MRVRPNSTGSHPEIRAAHDPSEHRRQEHPIANRCLRFSIRCMSARAVESPTAKMSEAHTEREKAKPNTKSLREQNEVDREIQLASDVDSGVDVAESQQQRRW